MQLKFMKMLCGLGLAGLVLIGMVTQVSAQPGSAQDFAERGDRLAEQGNYEQAISLYNEAILRDPANSGFYVRRANAYADLGDFENAIADYIVAIQLKPDDAIAYYDRALVYEETGQIEQALQDYTLAIQNDPNDPLSYFQRGSIYVSQGNYSAAAPDFLRASELDPSDMFSLLELGNSYIALGQDAEALQAYERYLTLAGAGADSTVVARVEQLRATLNVAAATPTPQVTQAAATPVPVITPTPIPQDPLLVVQPSAGGQQRGAPLLILRHQDLVVDAIKNRDETKILSWSLDGTARVWDAATGAQLLTLSHERPVNGARWNRDETRIMTWGRDSTVKIWDALTGTILANLEHDAPVEAAAWNRDETRILAWAGQDAVFIWDITRSIPLLKIVVEGRLLATTWSPQDDYILTTLLLEPTCLTDCEVEMQVWDARTGVAILSFPGQNFVDAGWSQGGDRVLASIGDTVQVWATGGAQFPTAAGIPGGVNVIGGTNADNVLCTVSSENNVTKRSQPSTKSVRFGTLYANQNAEVIGQGDGDDGFNWWRLGDGSWVRSDVVRETGNCDAVPEITE